MKKNTILGDMRFAEAVNAVILGEATPGQMEFLEARMRGDPAAFEEYGSQVEIHAGLALFHGGWGMEMPAPRRAWMSTFFSRAAALLPFLLLGILALAGVAVYKFYVEGERPREPLEGEALTSRKTGMPDVRLVGASPSSGSRGRSPSNIFLNDFFQPPTPDSSMKTMTSAFTAMLFASIAAAQSYDGPYDFYLNTHDTSGTTPSFANAAAWNTNAVPTAVAAFAPRAPYIYLAGGTRHLRPDGTASRTFGGANPAALVIDDDAKYVDKIGDGNTTTFANLILRGAIFHGDSNSNPGGFVKILAGNFEIPHDADARIIAIDTFGRTYNLNASFTGSGTLSLIARNVGADGFLNPNDNNTGGIGPKIIRLQGDSSGFTGPVRIMGGNGGNNWLGTANWGFDTPSRESRASIHNEANLGGNPAAFNAEQLHINNAILELAGNPTVLTNENRGITIGPSNAMFENANEAVIGVPITGGKLFKRGAGRLVLNGVNTVALEIVEGAVGGTGSVGGLATLPANAVIDLRGNGIGAFTLSNPAGVALDNATLHFDIAAGGVSDRLAIGGPLTLVGANTITLSGPLSSGMYTLVDCLGTNGAGTVALDQSYADARLLVDATGITLVIADEDSMLKIEGEPLGVGVADPAFGWLSGIAAGSNFTVSVGEAWTNDTQDVAAIATGWRTEKDDGTGTGNFIPAACGPGNTSSGAGAVFSYTHPDAQAKITWEFAVHHLITATAGPGGGGHVTGGGWCESSQSLVLEAFPDSGNTLLRWVGDTEDGIESGNTLTLPGDRPRTVWAVFFTGVQYVATAANGGSDANDGFSPGGPKLTLAAAVATLLEGGGTGVVHVAAGTYEPRAEIALTNAVVIRGMSGNPLDTTVSRATGFGEFCVFNINHPGARVENLTVRNGVRNLGSNIYIADGVVSNCLVTASVGGTGHNQAGGVYMAGGLVTHCVIRDNRISTYGGSDYTPGVKMLGGRLEHCLLTGNTTSSTGTAGDWAGAIWISGGSVVNCTVYGNTSSGAGGVYASGTGGSVINTVITGNNSLLNTANASWGVNNTAGAANIYNNCFVDTAAPNATCTNVLGAVLFTNPGGYDFTPAPNSPLIDAGIPIPNPPAWDLAGIDRVQGPAIDVGAYEFNTNQFMVAFTADNTVDFATTADPAGVWFTVETAGAAPGDDVRFYWNFGDGGTSESTQLETFKEYPAGGRYTVTLTATNFTANPPKHAVLTRENYLHFAPPVIYVDSANTAPGASLPPYDTPENATTSITNAVAFAIPNCEIILLKGDYPITASIRVDKPLRIRGKTGIPEDVVVRCASGSFNMFNLNHAEAFVESLVIQDGWGNSLSGAGLYIGSFGGTVSNCVIRGCGGSFHHTGTAANLNSAAALLTHCVISNNNVSSRSGWEGVDAGVIYLANGRVENCLVVENYFNFNDAASMDNLSVIDVRNGGVRNCTIAANRTANRGVVHIPGNAGLVEYCVIAGNYTNTAAKAVGPHCGTADPLRVNTCTTDGETELNNTCNLGTVYQIFKAFDDGNYRLKTFSPAVNAGPRVNPATVAATDLDGNPRVYGSRIDNGCYELQTLPGTLFMVR